MNARNIFYFCTKVVNSVSYKAMPVGNLQPRPARLKTTIALKRE